MNHEARRLAMTFCTLLGAAACGTVDPPEDGETGLTSLTEDPGAATLSAPARVSCEGPACAAIDVLPASTPYAGVIQIPGRVEAENFDHGGEGSAYHDSWAYNQGQQYRTDEGVDIEWSNAEGGYNVGWAIPGEWLGYSVHVSQSGSYTVHARVASAVDGGTFHVEVGGVDRTGAIRIPYTGGWDSWQTVTVTEVWLDAGPQTLRIAMDTAGGGENVGNINFIEIVSSVPCAAPRLRWAPPALIDPETIVLGTGPVYRELEDDQDYIIRFPAQKKVGKTHLVGGRNIHIIGGYATVAPGESERVIFLQGQQGIVHIEGLLIDNSGGREADGIAIAAPEAIVQLQNLRIVNLVGGYDRPLHNHSDVVQPWGGVGELRIDRLTGSSNYQGLFLKRDLGPVGPVIIQNTNLYYQPAAPNEGGHMLWLHDDCSVGSVTLSNVYVTPEPGVRLGKAIWPEDENGSCPALVIDNRATWPHLPQVSGSVVGGAPPGGDFVPAGAAGLGYVSPGYCQ